MMLPLTAEIFVNFNGSHLDLSRLRGGGEGCTTDLAAIYMDLFTRLRARNLYFDLPANNRVSWAYSLTGPDASEALGGWDPESRMFVLHADLALAPELVRDVVAHEMVHQIITQFPQRNDYDNGGHGQRFYHVAALVAETLELPMPRQDTVEVWPTLDRPQGYYGPLVQTRAGVPA